MDDAYPSAVAVAALALPDDPAALKAIVAEQHQSLREAQARIMSLESRLDGLLRRLYGPRSERLLLDPRQLVLFSLEVAQAQIDPRQIEQETGQKLSDRRATSTSGHGRRQLPADLPRQRVEHPIDPAELVCPDCGQAKARIGSQISEQLEYVPASLFVIEHVRPKYACKDCQAHVSIAPKSSDQVIDKGLPGPGLVAYVATSKYADHLPLYRLEGIFARHGVQIARSTMCAWMMAAAALLSPLVRLMADRIRTSRVIHTDDTPVPVQDPDRPGRTRTGRLWVYIGDPDNPYLRFDYTASRSRDGPANWLADYKGYLQADAFGGYDGIYTGGDVIEVACWAHARRKFHDARGTDSARAHAALALIRRLYDVEDAVRAEVAKIADEDLAQQDAVRVALRRSRSVPILAELHEWLHAQRRIVLPKSPIAQAMSYALGNWPALCRYAEQAFLSIDNNTSERALRRVAIGRKNWLFAGSDRGGHAAAVFYSLIASAQRHDLDPLAYLRGVLARIASTPMSQLEQFLPDQWASELQTRPQKNPPALLQ